MPRYYDLVVAEGSYLANVAKDLSQQVTDYFQIGYHKEGNPSITVYHKDNNSKAHYIISQVVIK